MDDLDQKHMVVMDDNKEPSGAIVRSEKEKDDRSKKRKLLDAATGTAWGSKSYSAAKIQLIRESGNDSGKGYDDFGRYFAEKQRKLREQYHHDSSSTILREAAAATAAQHGSKDSGRCDTPHGNSLIFQGVSIFVDGFTTPTHQELRFIMMNNGGVFENYFSRHRVTHIICSILPDNKIMNPRMLSGGLPIVKPEWIVESMKANKLLPWQNFQHERIALAHPGQQKIAGRFLSLKDASVSTTTPQAVGNSMREGILKESESLNYKTCGSEASETDLLLHEPNEVADETHQGHEFSRLSMGPPPVHPDSMDEEQKEKTSEQIEREETEVENKERGGARRVHKVGKETDATNAANRPFRSSLSDSDFVKNFFKYSRLHFIGTWRTRYQSLANSYGNVGGVKSKDRELMEANSDGKPMVIHIDMDCFFVSVVVRNHPNLVGKPVAVCHSNSDKGTAEISSANYPARSYGIRAGMFVKSAKALCPDLKIVSYDFAGYEEVADKVYNILHHHCAKVKEVSCDEAFLDVTGHPDPVDLALRIRKEIHTATRCTASAGIAENLLLARLATKKAKPNGLYAIKSEEVSEFVAALPVEELPGVGWALQEKLQSLKITSCADVLSVSKEFLQKQLGTKTGNMLWCFAQGIDDREVVPPQERKSIGAEVNWGVRFESMDDAQKFLSKLSQEVADRLISAGYRGRTVTLKIKKRKENAGEPHKFMGHGLCDNLSRSETLGYSTNKADIFLRIGRQLYASLRIEPEDVRGMGLQVSRLESTNTGSRKGHKALDKWLAPALHGENNVNEKFPQPQEEQEKLHSEVPDTLPRDIQTTHEAAQVKVGRTAFGELKDDYTNSEIPEVGPSPSPSSALPSPPLGGKKKVQQVLHGAGQNMITLRTPPKGQKAANSPSTRKMKWKNVSVKSKSSPLSTTAGLPPPIPQPQQPKAARKVSFGVPDQDRGTEPVLPPGDSRSIGVLAEQKLQTGVHDIARSYPHLNNHPCLRPVLDCLETTMIDNTRLSSLLFCSGSCPHTNGKDEREEISNSGEVVQQCVMVVTEYLKHKAPRDLEEIQLVYRYIKRLGSRCKLWEAVEIAAAPILRAIVLEHYGGYLKL